MKKIFLFLIPLFAFILLACNDKSPDDTEEMLTTEQGQEEVEEVQNAELNLEYEVVERKDISFMELERLTLKVLLPTFTSKEDIAQITEYLVDREREEKSFSEITIWFYDDKEDIPYSYTVGMAVYTSEEGIEYTFREE